MSMEYSDSTLSHCFSTCGTGAPLVLPRIAAHRDRFRAHPKTADTAATKKPILSEERQLTALLVDDEAGVRNFVEVILTTLGYRVFACSDGAEALRFADHHEGGIDLLVTDLVMPHLGGMELAQKLLAARPEMSVLLMSGFSHDKQALDQLLANRSGVDFLQKPFKLAELERSVQALEGSV